MALRLCSTKNITVQAIQYTGHGWFEALKELHPAVEMHVTPFSTAVTLRWAGKTRSLHPDDWVVVHDGDLTTFTPDAFELVFGDDE